MTQSACEKARFACHRGPKSRQVDNQDLPLERFPNRQREMASEKFSPTSNYTGLTPPGKSGLAFFPMGW
jgi:hypothetical protein